LAVVDSLTALPAASVAAPKSLALTLFPGVAEMRRERLGIEPGRSLYR
jgi:hypothetical protein